MEDKKQKKVSGLEFIEKDAITVKPNEKGEPEITDGATIGENGEVTRKTQKQIDEANKKAPIKEQEQGAR